MLQLESTLLDNFKIHLCIHQICIARGFLSYLTSYAENVRSAQTDICHHICLLCAYLTSDQICMGIKLLLLCSGFSTFYIERIYCLEVKQPKDGTLWKRIETDMRCHLRQHCRLSICSYFGWLWQILNLRRAGPYPGIWGGPGGFWPPAISVLLWGPTYSNLHLLSSSAISQNFKQKILKTNQ